MNKVIVSSLALLGLSVAFVAPAKANPLVNSTTTTSSMTGAAVVTNMNGVTNAMAVQVTFPASVYAESATVTPAYGGDATANNMTITSLAIVAGSIVENPASVNTFESAAATALIDAADLSEQVSLIRAWRSGLN